MVWYSHLFKNSPQFVVIYTVKGFTVVNGAEVDVFLELRCLLHSHLNGNLFLTTLPLQSPACMSGSSHFTYC